MFKWNFVNILISKSLYLRPVVYRIRYSMRKLKGLYSEPKRKENKKKKGLR
jgi:hypothetical protein